MALIAAHLNAGHSGGDSVAIGISVDVRHHVYLLTATTRMTHALKWAAMRAIFMFHEL